MTKEYQTFTYKQNPDTTVTLQDLAHLNAVGTLQDPYATLDTATEILDIINGTGKNAIKNLAEATGREEEQIRSDLDTLCNNPDITLTSPPKNSENIFQNEEKRINTELKIRIDKFGSRAVGEDFPSKDIYDIFLLPPRAKNIEQVICKLKNLGYEIDQIGTDIFFQDRIFMQRITEDGRKFYLHICPPNSWNYTLHKLWNLKLRSNADLRNAYAEVKREASATAIIESLKAYLYGRDTQGNLQRSLEIARRVYNQTKSDFLAEQLQILYEEANDPETLPDWIKELADSSEDKEEAESLVNSENLETHISKWRMIGVIEEKAELVQEWLKVRQREPEWLPKELEEKTRYVEGLKKAKEAYLEQKAQNISVAEFLEFLKSN